MKEQEKSPKLTVSPRTRYDSGRGNMPENNGESNRTLPSENGERRESVKKITNMNEAMGALIQADHLGTTSLFLAELVKGRRFGKEEQTEFQKKWDNLYDPYKDDMKAVASGMIGQLESLTKGVDTFEEEAEF